KMAVAARGKASRTKVRVVRREATRSTVWLTLTTGRTHQIRVHMAAIGHPVLGDRLYGDGVGVLQLHAVRLRFTHPANNDLVELTCHPPADFLGGETLPLTG